ncbi:MAG: M48 family metallopeptidase [Burkholderiales bacterium]|nr:M48 family metallopeptidase [Opitutaceae bacterium]
MATEHVIAVAWGLIAARLAAQLGLAALNRREVLRHADQPPAAVAAMVDVETFKKSTAYTLAKNRFGVVSLIFDAGVLALLLGSGILPWLFAQIGAWAPAAKWDDACFILAVILLAGVPGLPFEWWETFRLEARFGFNQTTAQLWVVDKIKGMALALAIGFPLLWGLLALVGWVGAAWWVWGFALLFGFQLLMVVLYPRVILPIFNKLTPLPEGALRERLFALANRTGFQASTIEVMDGSKRSGHANAFFTGFGRFRRIVLLDTLINQLTEEETEAVLAHEVGHYRRGHIPKMLATSAALQFAGFWAIAALAGSGWFNPGFGFPAGELAPAFLLFALTSGLVTFWFAPLGNRVSRKHEFEADAFAREAMGGPAPLVAALRKLASKSLVNLTPHPLFSAVYYSHPALVERERALTAAGGGGNDQ